MNAAGVKVQAYWPGLFVKLLQKKNVDDLILNAGSGQFHFQWLRFHLFFSDAISFINFPFGSRDYSFAEFLLGGGGAPVAFSAPAAGGAAAAADAPAVEEKKVIFLI